MNRAVLALVIIQALVFQVSCNTTFYHPAFEELPAPSRRTENLTYRINKSGSASFNKVDAEIVRSMRDAGFSLTESLPEKTAELQVYISSRKRPEDAAVMTTAFISGLSLFILPMKVPEQEMTVTYYIRLTDGKGLIRSYHFDYYGIDPGCIAMMKTISDPQREKEAVQKVTAQFVHDYAEASDAGFYTMYQSIRMKDGRIFFLANVKEQGAEMRILMPDGRSAVVNRAEIAQSIVLPSTLPLEEPVRKSPPRGPTPSSGGLPTKSTFP